MERKMKRRDFMKTTAAAGAGLTRVGSVSPKEDTDAYYDRLADTLDKLPNAFPRTKSNIEILLLKKIFTPDEAWLASQLTGIRESIDVIAGRTGLSVEETTKRLAEMTQRGFVRGSVNSGKFRLAPFIVGIYEAQLWDMDHELAHLIEDYMEEGGAEFMKPRPAIHRVVPAQSAVKTDLILPYDDVKAVLMASKSFRVRDCICRVQQDLLDSRKCDFPVHVCLNFAPVERPPSPRDISREEALDLLDEVEEIGLVHSVTNVAKGFYYVCNCCGCCCGILRGITEWGIENSAASANYYSVIDPDECTGCGKCVSTREKIG